MITEYLAHNNYGIILILTTHEFVAQQLWGARPTQDFHRSPDERTKGTLILCPCPGVDLPKLV